MKTIWVTLPVLLLPRAVDAQTAEDLVLARQLSAHVMQVRSATLGSAVAVGDHLAVTNCHVLGDAAAAYVARGSLSSRAKLRAGDTGHDLCLLELEDSPSFAPIVKPAAQLEPGDKVYAVGFGAGRLSFGVGVVNELYPYDGGSVVRFDASFAAGASGGGLFDREGNLVGVLTFFRHGAESSSYWAMPAEWIQALTTKSAVDRSDLPIWAAKRASSIDFLQVAGDEIDGKWEQMRTHVEEWLSNEPDSKPAIRALSLATSKLRQKPGTGTLAPPALPPL